MSAANNAAQSAFGIRMLVSAARTKYRRRNVSRSVSAPSRRTYSR
ncbi:hypothetical protein KY49_6723 [Burkholderia sp. MSHR3999]|nr:hypothetical protein KY49_6723 [Burkholderia sp. MSHR3999]